MTKNILLVVEGAADEVKFYRRLFEICYKKADYKIYSYKTNIHVLAQELYNHYPDFEDGDIDIRLILASLETDSKQKEILISNFTDIYMIFDFDPQHDHTHFDTVKKMIAFFNDSTNQGKLYINYPMMQSYKHFSVLPDDSFKDRTVTLDEVKQYKSLVANESNFTDLTKYDHTIFFSMAVHHIKKANYLLSQNYMLPSEKEFLEFDLERLYALQVDLLQSKAKISVVNTCIFNLCDFAPRKFFLFIQKHQDELQI